ncbi:MAG: carboxypeptidase-like regulatory domain-containing protein, partial [archaeon]
MAVGILDSAKNVYYALEDKWYNFLDKVNNYIPIYKVVDPIDKVFPSFALSLILFVLFLIILLAFLVSTFFSSTGNYLAEVTVLSSTGKPIEGVSLIVLNGCRLESGEIQSIAKSTDSNGKAEFIVCDTTIDVKAVKSDYKTFEDTIDLDEENKAQIRLSFSALPSRKVYAEVVDSENQTIEGADLEVKCLDTNTKLNFTDQNSSAFTFNTPTGCASIQFTGRAFGYEDKTQNMSSADARAIIILDKIVLKGKVDFETTCPTKNEPSVEIVVTNLDTKNKKTIYTDSQGTTRQEELDAGEYSFSSLSDAGDLNTGSFTLDVEERKTIKISFKRCSSDVNPDADSNTKYMWIKAVDGNSGVMGASVAFYVDGNILSTKTTSTNGETTKLVINQSTIPSSGTLRAVISKIGYQIKIVTVEPRLLSQGAQVVSISQGGGKINARVIDDTNAVVKDASVSIYMTGFPMELGQGTTDKNGLFQFTALPQSTYKIRAVSSKDEGTLEGINLNLNEIKDVNVRVIKSTGGIDFEFINESGSKTAVGGDLMEKASGVFRKNESFYAKSGSYSTPKLKVETDVYASLTDLNYIPIESPVYTITKTTAKKTLYLKSIANLPNSNSVQVFLENVYKSDPKYGSVQITDQIMPDTEYYLYFTVVITGDTTADLTANFFVSPEDKNSLIADNPFVINNAYSTYGSDRIMSSMMYSKIIDPANETYRVESGAKQANVLLHSQKGPRAFPVIVRMKVDENVLGQKAKIFFEAIHGDTNSLRYFKEFTIGEKFCLSDCPVFLFNNYIQWDSSTDSIDRNYVAIGEDRYVALIGDFYTLKTSVQNASDEAIGDSNLRLYITSQYLDNLKIASDANEAIYGITLAPLSTSSEKTTSLTPIKSTSSAKLYEAVSKMSGNADWLKGYEGNDYYMSLEVDTKEELEILLSPETLDGRSEYPVFVIKTRYKDGRRVVPAHWRAEILNSDNSIGALVAEGTTDINGMDITQLSLLNIDGGTKIQFYAEDENGAKPATLSVTLGSWPSIPEDPSPTECLTAYVGATKIMDIDNPQIALKKDELSTTVSIKSDCNEERIYYIESDGAEVVPKQATIAAGTTQTITITAKPRMDSTNNLYLLGAYPLQIMSISDGAYAQIGFLDVVVSEGSSCFTLNNAVYDFTQSSSISSYVTNNCYSGRLDNFYPQLDIGTNSVTLDYDKPGNPETVSFAPKVVGSALEGIIECYIWVTRMAQSTQGESCGDTVNLDSEVMFKTGATDEPFTLEDATAKCEGLVEKYNSAEDVAKEEPEPSTIPGVDWNNWTPSSTIDSGGDSSDIISDV